MNFQPIVSVPAINNPFSGQPTNDVDTDQNGTITPEELFNHFDCDGDGKIDIIDYAAHILYHQQNPQLLQPYMQQAAQKLAQNSDQYQSLSERLVDETLMVSNKDPKGTEKVRQALQKGEDIRVVDKNKINQFKLNEAHDMRRAQRLAGIIR